MMSASGPPYRLKIKPMDHPTSSAASAFSDCATKADQSIGESDEEDVIELVTAMAVATGSPNLAASAVWSEVDRNELDDRSASPTSIAAEAELYVDAALAEASPFDDPDEEEIDPDDAPPLDSVSFADPDEDTGAPTPATARPTSPIPDSFPLPPSIATFLSGLPLRADSLSSHLSSLLSEPATAPLRSLFSAAPHSVEELPVLARTFAGELNNLLGSALSGVRDEANQLRDEFETLKANIAQDKKDLEDRLRREWDEAVAQEKARWGSGEAKAEAEDEQEEAREGEHEVDEEKREEAAEVATEAAELVNEQGLPMDPASRAARKQQRHEARLARKALRHAERRRESKRAARADKSAASVDETASTSAVPAVESPAADATAAAEARNPFDDFCDSLAPSETSDVASTLTRVSTPRSLIGAYPVLPSFPDIKTAPVNPSDDFFNRRVGGPRSSMPGSFNPSASTSTLPAIDRSASAGYFVGNSILSRSNTMPAPSTAAAGPTMPGAFSTGSGEGASDSLFAGFVNRTGTPMAGPGQGGWGEVTPDQVKEAVGRLGFDLKELGVRIAAERAWEELRGKTLAEMVAMCVDKLV